MNPIAFDDEGHPIPVSDFDWSVVEHNLAVEKKQLRAAVKAGEVTQEDFDRAVQLCATMMRWVWQDGKRDTRGVAIRSIILCWLFLAELRPLTETQLARGFGLKKQSINRWIQVLKSDLPMLRSANLR